MLRRDFLRTLAVGPVAGLLVVLATRPKVKPKVGYPSGTNRFVPNHSASHGPVVGYNRSVSTQLRMWANSPQPAYTKIGGTGRLEAPPC